ncbi:MAG: dihydrofolate reductase family protein [Nostoc sp.]|uniref:dihydrofolate reductase family protein n=1 Tax=Nostoc sp. TaxID=1180 RepID=UPI002FF73B65
MSKLKLQMQISVDGFVATGPNDEQKWVTLVWDEVKQYVLELIDTTDTIVIGRKLAVDYIPYWENVSTKPDDPFYEAAQRIVRARKVVFTKTFDKSEWDNTDLAKGNLVEEIEQIKSNNKKDIIV